MRFHVFFRRNHVFVVNWHVLNAHIAAILGIKHVVKKLYIWLKTACKSELSQYNRNID